MKKSTSLKPTKTRYFAIEHKDKVRPGTGRERDLGYVRREAFQSPSMYSQRVLAVSTEPSAPPRSTAWNHNNLRATHFDIKQ